MKWHVTFVMVLVLFALATTVQAQKSGIQSDTSVINITILSSGGGNVSSDKSQIKLVFGEPLVGNVTSDKSQIRYGFFQTQKQALEFLANPNNPPNQPIWINPENNTAILDSNLVILEYSSSDPDGDAITYYLYQNETFIRTSPYNVSVRIDNGSYTYTVSAYDGNKFSANASTTFFVDVPPEEGVNVETLLFGIIPMFASAILMAAGFLASKEEHAIFRHMVMLFSLVLLIPVLTFGFALNNATFEGPLSQFLWIVIIILFAIISYFAYYLVVKLIYAATKRKQEADLKY